MKDAFNAGDIEQRVGVKQAKRNIGGKRVDGLSKLELNFKALQCTRTILRKCAWRMKHNEQQQHHLAVPDVREN